MSYFVRFFQFRNYFCLAVVLVIVVVVVVVVVVNVVVVVSLLCNRCVPTIK